MAGIRIDEHGGSDCICDGSHWLVVYQDTKLCFFGQHAGKTTTKGTIDYYDTEQEALDRVDELNLEDPLGFIA